MRRNAGYLPSVDEWPGPCAFPQCSRSAGVTLQLQVEEDQTVLTVCDRHADWLRDYAPEDDAVDVVNETPALADRVAEDELADPASAGALFERYGREDAKWKRSFGR